MKDGGSKNIKNKKGVNEMLEKEKYKKVRDNTDDMIEELDEQAVKNFELNLEVNKLRSELRHNLEKLGEHTYCPSDQHIDCAEKSCNKSCSNEKVVERVEEKVKEVFVPKEESKVEGHPVGCHCKKCCPNPKPNFFQRNKNQILIGVLWVALIILAVGWSPSGATFDAMQNSWVELIVNFFKMGVFAVAGIATYNLFKKRDE